MPKSEAFIRIKEHVLQIVATIPESRLCTYHDIGEYLDVMPRHVAYILSQLDDAAKMIYPWHRVVAHDGSLGVLKRGPHGRSQAELLADEGIAVTANRVSPGLDGYYVAVEQLPHGLPRQTRPAPSAAPSSVRRKPRRSG